MPSADEQRWESEEERLRCALAEANDAVTAAYRETTRLIRLFQVLGQQGDPDELVDRALTELSEAFVADVVCVASVYGSRLLVTGACGLAEDDPAFAEGWPLGGGARRALATRRPVVSADADAMGPEDLPGSIGALGVDSAVWLPLSSDENASDLLMLFRRCGQPYGRSDLTVLSSVAYRLGLAVEERERTAVMERLAQSGHWLTRHLELSPLLDEAVDLLRQLTSADRAWILTLEEGQALLRAHRGLPASARGGWPRPIAEVDRCWAVAGAGLSRHLDVEAAGPVPRWPAQRDGAECAWTDGTPSDGLRPDGAPVGGEQVHGAPVDGARVDEERVDGARVGIAPDGTTRLAGPLMKVPVSHEGTRSALLFAERDRPCPFSREEWDAVKIFASQLGVAIANARLCRVLRQGATHDSLTGLGNRLLVSERLEEALRRQAQGHVGLLFCDLDGFKAVNDRLGHEAGDELLQQVAQRLRKGVRRDDVLARFGGDEFVIVLDGVHDLAEVTAAGDRVAAALDAPFALSGQREWVRVSASVGGVLGIRGYTTASAMLRDADAAMYTAKEKGNGLVEVFDDAASHRSLQRLDLRSELLHALEREELRARYQPVVSLDSGRVLAFEALLNWDHPRRGTIPAAEFLGHAEETGAIVPIGYWVLNQACRQLAQWRREYSTGIGITISVSAVQLGQPNMVAKTLTAIREAGVAPSDVWLELSQHGHIRDEVAESAAALHAAGVHFALGDFGTVCSNLAHLRRFPFEMVKIDRSYVAGVVGKQEDRGVVRAIVAIADSLGLTAVAEGVETADQRTALVALGCYIGQGGLLADPLDPDEAAALLASPAGAAALPVPSAR